LDNTSPHQQCKVARSCSLARRPRQAAIENQSAIRLSQFSEGQTQVMDAQYSRDRAAAATCRTTSVGLTSVISHRRTCGKKRCKRLRRFSFDFSPNGSDQKCSPGAPRHVLAPFIVLNQPYCPELLAGPTIEENHKTTHSLAGDRREREMQREEAIEKLPSGQAAFAILMIVASLLSLNYATSSCCWTMRSTNAGQGGRGGSQSIRSSVRGPARWSG